MIVIQIGQGSFALPYFVEYTVLFPAVFHGEGHMHFLVEEILWVRADRLAEPLSSIDRCLGQIGSCWC